MAIAYLCILIAAILPIVFAGYAKFSSKGYDNNKPREFLEGLQGKSKRAHYAQLNSFEAFPMFAVAVIIAHMADVTKMYINIFAVVFVICRIFYGMAYIADKSLIRSVFWGSGLICILFLYTLAILRA